MVVPDISLRSPASRLMAMAVMAALFIMVCAPMRAWAAEAAANTEPAPVRTLTSPPPGESGKLPSLSAYPVEAATPSVEPRMPQRGDRDADYVLPEEQKSGKPVPKLRNYPR